MAKTKKRVRSDEITIEEQGKLGKLMLAFMEKIGAKMTWKREYEASTDNEESTQYDFSLQTPIGELRISFGDPGYSLFCRFDEPARAHETMGELVGPYGGKYNTFVFEKVTAERAFETVFKNHIEAIWRLSNVKIPWKEESVSRSQNG